MRGMQLRISLPLLLDLIGLEAGQIQLGAAAVDVYTPDTLVLVLRGEDERLPEVEPGKFWPRGNVVVVHDKNRPGVRGEIVELETDT